MARSQYSHLGDNLRYLLAATGASQKVIAHKLGISPSFVSKLVGGKANPSPILLERVAISFGLRVDDLLLPNTKLRLLVLGSDRRVRQHTFFDQGRAPLVRFDCITKHEHLWEGCFRRHRGQYILYNLLSDQPELAAASLMDIEMLTERGIQISIMNPSRSEDGHWFAYKYVGLLYPIAEFLYIFAEQLESDYELLSVIVKAAPEPVPDILEGVITGIGVRTGNKKIAQQKLVMKYQKRRVRDWHALVGSRLGILEKSTLPRYVLERLIEQT